VIDHPPSGHDDVANAVCGALLMVKPNPVQEIPEIGCIQVAAGPRPAWLDTDDYGPNSAGFGVSVGGL
jgi:hypothetical protein